MLLQLLAQTCQILKPTTVASGFGTQGTAKTWPATGPTHPCRLQLVGGTEDSDLRDLSIGQWKLFLPADADITEKDRVIVDGSTFEVVTVYPVHTPRGLHHYEVTLQTFSGGVPSG